MLMSKFGEKLRYLRTQHRLTVRQLANEVNVSYGHLARMERGESVPTLSIAYKISQYFNVSLDDLANDKVTLE